MSSEEDLQEGMAVDDSDDDFPLEPAKKRRRTKEDEIYGIFKGNDSDSDSSGAGRGGRARRAGRTLHSSELEFVTAGEMKSESSESGTPKARESRAMPFDGREADEAADAEVEAEFHRLLHPERGQRSASRGVPLDRSTPAAAPSLTQAQGEKLSKKYGKGFKMMEKMGFSGKLGQNENGLAAPIIAAKRGKNLGLGSDQTERQKPVVAARSKSSAPDYKALLQEQLQDRSATPRVKTQYFIHGVQTEQSEFIDLTPKDDSESGTELSAEDARARANLHLINQITDNIRYQETLLSHHQRSSGTVETELKRLSEELKTYELQEEALDFIFETLRGFECHSMEEFSILFSLLRRKYPIEFHKYSVLQVAPHFLDPVFKARFGDWNPLEDWSLLAADLVDFRDTLLSPFTGTFENQYETSEYRLLNYLMERFIQSVLLDDSIDIFSSKIMDPLLVILESLRDLLSPISFMSFVKTTLDGKIDQKIKDWNPTRPQRRIHEWLIPLKPYCSADRLEPWCSIIATTIRKCMTSWNGVDESAAKLIVPLKDLLSDQTYQNLIQRCIFPKIRDYLKGSIVVAGSKAATSSGPATKARQRYLTVPLLTDRPSDKDDLRRQLRTVLQWLEYLPPSQRLALVEGELFHKIYTQIYDGLTVYGADYLREWYEFWKSLLEPLSDRDYIRSYLVKLLRIVQSFFTQQTIIYDPLEEQSYEICLQKYSDLFLRKGKPLLTESAPREEHYTFQDVVTAFASANDLPFVPAEVFEGRRLYFFGRLKFYFDDWICYAFNDESGHYEAMSLEEMLDQNH